MTGQTSSPLPFPLLRPPQRQLVRFGQPDQERAKGQPTAPERATSAGYETAPGRRAGSYPSPRRWALVFTVIGILVAIFGAISLWGLAQSDWLYGTYGQIEPAQWDRMALIRDELRRLDPSLEAIAYLDDALLVPRPSTQEVLYDLHQAAATLDAYTADADLRKVRAGLHALIIEIAPHRETRPTLSPPPTPRPRRIEGVPLAQLRVSPSR